MEQLPQFKVDGDLSLSVPVTAGFDKILHDFVWLTASQSGFPSDESTRIAGRISSLLQEHVGAIPDNGQPARLHLNLAHHPGRVTITATIAAISFSREEHFKVQG
jgi:hypothetical protein